MRIGIGFKLFVAVLAASVVMAVAMSIANRISFQRGFLGYLNEVETRRLNVLTTVLAAHWREVGDPEHGWDALRLLFFYSAIFFKIYQSKDSIFQKH